MDEARISVPFDMDAFLTDPDVKAGYVWRDEIVNEGRKLRAQREQSRLTIGELAAIVGVQEQLLETWELGIAENRPAASVLEALEQACRRRIPRAPGSTRALRTPQTRFRPLQDFILCQRSEPFLMSAGGIIIPDTAQGRPVVADVLAVGPGRRSSHGFLIQVGIEVGDRVLFGRRAGTEIKIEGQDLLILKPADILAVMDALPETRVEAA